MKALFHSKVFRRLFYSYIAVILGSMIIYTAFLSNEHYRIRKFQVERQTELQLQQVGAIFDMRMMNARNIVQNLRYSTALRPLYMSQRLNEAMDPGSIDAVQSELKNTMASTGLMVYKTAIFIEGDVRAYSSGGMIILSQGFESDDISYPCMAVGSLNDIFHMDSKRYSFGKECLVYCDAYTYQTGAQVGTIAILFDLDNLRSELEKCIGQGYGAVITYGDNELMQIGETDGNVMTAESTGLEGLTYSVIASKNIKYPDSGWFHGFIILIVLLSAGFIVAAFLESKKYYMPIDHLDQIVNGPRENRGEADEMEGIINGIRELIGEKNVYREKMLTISPYVKAGVLHSVMNGNIGAESIRVLSEENYFDLVKPYFIVCAVNLYNDGATSEDTNFFGPKLRELLRTIADTLSTDEIKIVSYYRDVNHIFFIANSDSENINDEIFYSLQKHLVTALSDRSCVVTVGVDRLRDDINELQDACNGAVSALDGILTDGRGEVYFLDDNSGRTTEYYFPANFREKLVKYLEKAQKGDITALLKDIYERNWKLAGTPGTYKALIDELHLEVIKALREITELNMTHLSIEKYSSLATLSEVFNYYNTALCSIVDSLISLQIDEAEDEHLEEAILQYIEDNTFDPDLSLQGISDKFKVSNKYLSILCKKHYGETYLQHLQNIRIKRAAELLAEKKYSLSEIALMCGYTNQLTFRRNFKSIMGQNPSDYE